MLKIKCILALSIFLFKASGLDLELIVRIKIPVDVQVNEFLQGQIISRKDGAFIAEGYFNTPFGIAVKPDKSYFYFRPVISKNSQTEKIISTGIENGKQFTVKEIENIGESSTIYLDTIFQTISNKGVIIEELIRIGKTKGAHKYYSDSTVLWLSSSSTNYTSLKYTKYNSDGVIVSTKEIIQNRVSGRQQRNFSDSLGPIIIPEFKDGYAYFYRLTDSDLLSSPNRITLGSSQNGSLTATVNNPEQALLNIQSSTNLIDWNTFKTIQNEPSLELVIPANKPKEFIRAIE
jgi:hypothetical protein